MKKYYSYKDSGIEWIGEIPEHWGKRRIKYSYDLIMGQSPNSEDCNITGEGIPFLQGNADFGAKHPFPKNWCTKPTKKAPTNSILLSVRAPIGEVNLANQEYCIGRGLCALTNENPKYLYYISLCLHDEFNSLGTGSTFKAISTEQILNTSTVIPTLQEQTSIASFLDLKTSEIDDIIADKKRLLELYEEEKTAIINQAVTKGLDPNAPMKDSGIEWLGEIPEHWEAVKFNHYVFLRHGYQFRDYDFTPTGLKIIKITQLKPNGDLEVNDVSFIDESRLDEFKNILIEDGDILMALTGGTIGKIIRTPVINEPLLQNYRVGNFFPVNERLSKDYLFWVLSSEMILKQIFYDQRETGQPNIGKEDFGRMIICLPNTIKEQEEIVEFIKDEIKRIDFKKARTEELIELLTEYRTALISEAVTGKIKVSED